MGQCLQFFKWTTLRTVVLIREVIYLGFRVNKKGIFPHREKIEDTLIVKSDKDTEAAVNRCSSKKVLLKILQISQENA